MSDFRYVLLTKIIVAFVSAVFVYFLLSPFLAGYFSIIGVFQCGTNTGFDCALTQTFVQFIIPIAAVFFAISEIFGVFLK